MENKKELWWNQIHSNTVKQKIYIKINLTEKKTHKSESWPIHVSYHPAIFNLGPNHQLPPKMAPILMSKRFFFGLEKIASTRDDELMRMDVYMYRLCLDKSIVYTHIYIYIYKSKYT